MSNFSFLLSLLLSQILSCKLKQVIFIKNLIGKLATLLVLIIVICSLQLMIHL